MCIGGGHPNDTKDPLLTTMTFTYTFKPQAKPTQKIDFDMIQEISPDKLKQIEYAKELNIQQIAERAFDDLTGASYVTDGIETIVFTNGTIVTTDSNPKRQAAEAAADEITGSCGDFCDPKSPAVDQEALDAFTGNSGNGNGDDNPNPFDDTTGDPPGVPTNPKGGAQQQGSNDVTTFGSGGNDDPTNPDGGCEGDFDFWRPNPEEFKDFGSLSVVDFNDMSSSSEVDLLLHSMSVDTMGL